MQSIAMARVALLLSIVVQSAALSSNSQSVAWLGSHANPSPDELDELKGENPEAYALVKALLTKRSLGLLDPKHPTAAFSASATPAPLAADDQGPAAFAKFASQGSHIESAETVYPDAPATQHKDFFNWKPQQTGVDEDAEVQNVLGAVAAIAQPKSAPAAVAPTQNLRAVSIAKVAPVEDAKPVAAMGQENSYLKDIDFGIKAPVAQAPRSAPEDNSYLKMSGLNEDDSAPKKTERLTQIGAPKQDFLASFSWGDDSKPQAHHRSSLAVASSSVATQAKSTKGSANNNFMAWLDGKNTAHSHAVVTAAAPATTEQPKNAYMMDLE